MIHNEIMLYIYKSKVLKLIIINMLHIITKNPNLIVNDPGKKKFSIFLY